MRHHILADDQVIDGLDRGHGQLPPSSVSLPSPGFQMNWSLPAPMIAKSLPRPPVMVSPPPRPVT
ncbi:MAG TPA: hypothetical protein VHA35_19740 [Dongiaceae bacterium]|nr:hypothetical protein [Dongiaceae bacterium]